MNKIVFCPLVYAVWRKRNCYRMTILPYSSYSSLKGNIRIVPYSIGDADPGNRGHIKSKASLFSVATFSDLREG